MIHVDLDELSIVIMSPSEVINNMVYLLNTKDSVELRELCRRILAIKPDKYVTEITCRLINMSYTGRGSIMHKLLKLVGEPHYVRGEYAMLVRCGYREEQ